VPIVPPLFGCEVTEYIQPGQSVDIVGYGNTDDGTVGIKYQVTTTITGYQNGEVFIGGNGLDSCSGDSGGPVYVRLDDGSWRVFGITSYGGQCGSGGVYGNMATNLAWAEQQTGLDLTPCFDGQGNWTPNPTCGGFPMDPASGAGTTWQQGCGGGSVSGFAATCGSPFSSEADEDPPSITITAPADGATYDTGGTGIVQVTITADASDNVGLQVVSLMINGDPVAGTDDNVAPYSWNLEFPQGSWTIEAVATDYSQNQDSDVVTIGVDQEPEPPPPDPDTGGDGDTGNPDTGGDEESGLDPEGGLPPGYGLDEIDEGCACTTAPERRDASATIVSLLALLGLAGFGGRLRRRRRTTTVAR
jgi:MYXO-CTERM domain-containing protein